MCENAAQSHDICIKFHALIGNRTKRSREDGEEEEEDTFDPVGALTTLNDISLALLRPFLTRLSPVKLQEMVITAGLEPERFQRFLTMWTRLTTERVESPFRDAYVQKWVNELIDDTDLVWKNGVFATFEMYKSMFRVWTADQVESFVSLHVGPIDDFVKETSGNVNVLEDVIRKRAIHRYGHLSSLEYLLRHKASDNVLLAWFEWRNAVGVLSSQLEIIVKNAYL